MNKRIVIEEKKNGWIVRMEGFTKVDGEYVYKATETTDALELVGEHVHGTKVCVRQK